MNLKELIKNEGREIKWVSSQLGIEPMTFRTKRKSGAFSVPEIYYLSKMLNADIEAIKTAIKNEKQTS